MIYRVFNNLYLSFRCVLIILFKANLDISRSEILLSVKHEKKDGEIKLATLWNIKRQRNTLTTYKVTYCLLKRSYEFI